MTRMIRHIVFIFLGSLCVGSYVVIFHSPSIIFQVVNWKIPTAENEFYFSDLPNAETRVVVKPNPDFLYVTCFYDLSEGPLRITGTMPDTSYWSVAFYQPNTVNFFILNDRDVSTPKLDIIIAKENKDLEAISSSHVIRSPSSEGFLLFRVLVSSDSQENIQSCEEYQKSLRISPLQ